MIKWFNDNKNNPDYCRPCGSTHGPLYICKHYSKERKAKIRKSIPNPPKKYLFEVTPGCYVVWVSEDKKYMVTWQEGLFFSGYNLFVKIGETNHYEQPNYGTFYISVDGAKKAIKKLEGLNG